MKYIISLILICALCGQSLACSMFSFQVDGKTLVGNNEDYFDPDTWMWTDKSGKYGSVFFGFGNFFAQGGMNEAGLVFDGFAMEARKVNDVDGKKSTNPAKLIRKIMGSCTTVAEVEEIMKQYDLSFMENAQLMFVDRTGASLVVEGDDYVHATGDYHITTNFYQSSTAKSDFHKVCHRYAAGDKIMSEGLEYSIEYGESVLEAMHQEGIWGGTQYSNIYDLEEKKVYLYLFHNYKERLELSLDDLLKKGDKVQLKSLFTETAEYEEYAHAYERSKEICHALADYKSQDELREALKELESLPQAMLWNQQLFEAADKLQNEEKHEMAIALINYAKELIPQSWRLRAMLAKSLFMQKQLDAAEREITKAIELNPEEPSLIEARDKIRAAMEK
ncbi:MAG: linear amide C-N hydrolase [Bacteroidia bacterium]|nr:linear amide C-N hydrolase [Bacteroidia bacterium]